MILLMLLAVAMVTAAQTMTDPRDGKTYQTVTINGKVWMAENLKYGTVVNTIVPQTNNGIVESYAYGNNQAKYDMYAGNHTWNEAMNYTQVEGGQGICPTGWHIPTMDEWMSVVNAYGGLYAAGNAVNSVNAIGAVYWRTPNVNNNSTGLGIRANGMIGGWARTGANVGWFSRIWTSSTRTFDDIPELITYGNDDHNPYKVCMSSQFYGSFERMLCYPTTTAAVRCIQD